MTYKKAIDYLNSFVNYEQLSTYDYKASFKLDRMYALLDLLENPHKDLKVIHITGTKGKGSTAAITASILEKAGFKTGFYLSPHLTSFRERIKINGEEIGEDEVRKLVDEAKIAAGKSKRKDYTFFELYTAIAFLYFKERKVDFAVVEVGLGGRLDATNVVNPLIVCITPVSIDHTMQLGSSLEEIAKEKAAIIKRGAVCVSAPQQSEAREIIKTACREKDVRLYEVGKDIFYESLGARQRKEVFNIAGMYDEYTHLEMALLGEHQVMNAATAIGIIEALRFHNVTVPSLCIREGLEKVKWPGRLEVISERPLVVLDGAQNRASAAALRNAVKRNFKYNKLLLVLGASRDKDIQAICEELMDISDEVILTKADNVRAEAPSALKKYISKKSHLTGSVDEAVKLARNISKDEDLILITGSFFVVGEAKTLT